MMLQFMHVVAAPTRLERLQKKHPYLLCLGIVVGAPLGVLLAVALVATGIMLPISFFMGWL